MLLLCSCSERSSLKHTLHGALETAVAHYKAQAEYMEGFEGQLPRTFEKGEIKRTNPRNWVSGFFPASLWLLYQHTGDEQLREAAELFTRRLEELKDYRGTHDLGFMVFCPFGNAYRLTGDNYYKQVIEQASASLASRFNEQVGCIRSWNTSRKEHPEEDFIVIIDNMMNLEMLEWVGSYEHITRRHADTTIKNHFRDDYSTYHLVTYNELTGAITDKRTAQGRHDESAWARGQAWGLYGFTMMYRMSGEKRYLQQAEKIASFLLPRITEDVIPNWDLDASEQMEDSSAAAIMASAFIELYTITDNERYLDIAERQLRELCTEQYMAAPGQNGNFLLKHGVGHYTAGTEVDVPLSYGDYYFIEASLRYLAL